MKNKSVNIVKVVDIPIYHGKLVLILSGDMDYVRSHIEDFDCERVFAHAWHFEWKPESMEAFGMVLNFRDRSNMTHGAIAHEASHLASYIASSRGIVADFENDEPVAYLVSWIVDQIYYWLYEVWKETGDDEYASFWTGPPGTRKPKSE